MGKQKIRNKCDTSENWSKSTFIPKEGEIIVYSDLHKMKVGDGIHQLNDLSFVNNTPSFNGKFKIF